MDVSTALQQLESAIARAPFSTLHREQINNAFNTLTSATVQETHIVISLPKSTLSTALVTLPEPETVQTIINTNNILKLSTQLDSIHSTLVQFIAQQTTAPSVISQPISTTSQQQEYQQQPPPAPNEPSEKWRQVARNSIPPASPASHLQPPIQPPIKTGGQYSKQIILKTSQLPVDHLLRTGNKLALLNAVQNALGDAQVQIIHVQLLSESQDLQITLHTTEQARILSRNRDWITKLDPNLKFSHPFRNHAAVVHRVPIQCSIDEAISILSAHGKIKELTRINSRKPAAQYGSIRIVFEEEESTFNFLQENSVFLWGTQLVREAWDPEKKEVQCLKCAKWGHKVSSCREEERCGRCASKEHRTASCTVKEESEYECRNCGKNVVSWHRDCPARHPTKIPTPQFSTPLKPILLPHAAKITQIAPLTSTPSPMERQAPPHLPPLKSNIIKKATRVELKGQESLAKVLREEEGINYRQQLLAKASIAHLLSLENRGRDEIDIVEIALPSVSSIDFDEILMNGNVGSSNRDLLLEEEEVLEARGEEEEEEEVSIINLETRSHLQDLGEAGLSTKKASPIVSPYVATILLSTSNTSSFSSDTTWDASTPDDQLPTLDPTWSPIAKSKTKRGKGKGRWGKEEREDRGEGELEEGESSDDVEERIFENWEEREEGEEENEGQLSVNISISNPASDTEYTPKSINTATPTSSNARPRRTTFKPATNTTEQLERLSATKARKSQ